MGCQHLDDLYELFLLGASGEASETAEIGEHVARGCPYCLERLREATQVVCFLVENLRPRRALRPDPKARAQVLRRASKLNPNP